MNVFIYESFYNKSDFFAEKQQRIVASHALSHTKMPEGELGLMSKPAWGTHCIQCSLGYSIHLYFKTMTEKEEKQT